jgi:hypothetical protein
VPEFKIDPKARAKLKKAARGALPGAAQQLLAASQRVVPVQTGHLEESGSYQVDGDTAAVGYSDPKAVAAHENLQDRHDPGRSAKYLERPLLAMRRDFLDAVVTDARNTIGK